MGEREEMACQHAASGHQQGQQLVGVAGLQQQDDEEQQVEADEEAQVGAGADFVLEPGG